MSRPRFSILTPTKDRPEWLPRALGSLQVQTFRDFECIVYDNGSESVEHLLPRDSRIRYVFGPAEGVADAFERARQLAGGEIITPLSDDDRLPPEALEIVDRSIGEAEWLTGLTHLLDTNDELIVELGGQVLLEKLRRKYYLGGAVYWRRELGDRVGGFDNDFDGAGDYDLYLRMAEAAPAAFVDEVLYLCTDHPGTDTNQRTHHQRAQTRRIKARAA